MATETERKAKQRHGFRLAAVDALFVKLPPCHRREPVYLLACELKGIPEAAAKTHYALASALAGAVDDLKPLKEAKRAR